ncbi:MAG: hypothetical protein A2Z29_03465 [Chloroflexi bacterium RBG_16_56_11]|nr:MAG: hypothetical protein A2Z29_03465 [Chloroflexi bacterium RBG_16_56_11]
MTTLKTVAGMPAFNESKYIGSLVITARQYVDEVVVIDDGSSDNTAEIAALAGAQVTKHPVNRGYGAAVQSVMEEARKRNADILVLLDADGQHNPREIPAIIQPIRDGYDFVIGTRKEQAGNIPLYRRVGQGVILHSINLLSKRHLTDSECGFRAFSRKAIETLNLKENGMAISAETVAEAARRHLRVAEVPVSATYDKDSSTLNPVAHGLGVFTSVLIMISERKPLFFFGLAGVILTIFGLVAGIVSLQLYSDSGVVSIGWTLVSIFFIIMGAISFFTGLTLRAISSIIISAISREDHR